MQVHKQQETNINQSKQNKWLYLENWFNFSLQYAKNCRYIGVNRKSTKYRQGNWSGFLHDALDHSPMMSRINSREFLCERYYMKQSSFYKLHNKIEVFIGTQGCGMSNHKMKHQFLSSYEAFSLFNTHPCITTLLVLHKRGIFLAQ